MDFLATAAIAADQHLHEIESVHLLPAAHPNRLSHVWEQQHAPFLEQTLTFFDCNFDTILDQEIESDFVTTDCLDTTNLLTIPRILSRLLYSSTTRTYF